MYAQNTLQSYRAAKKEIVAMKEIRLAVIANVAQRVALQNNMPPIEYDFDTEREVITLCMNRNSDADTQE